MKRKRVHRNWLKVLPVLLITALFIWAVKILLAEDNWLAISALATLVLAFVASWSIWQTRDMQKSEKRESLLNEIIEWAIDVLKLNSDLNSFTEYVRLEFITVSSPTIDKLYSDTMAFRDKGKSIKIISSVAGDKVNNAASELQNELDKIAGVLNDIRFKIEVGEDPVYLSQLVTTEDAMMLDRDVNKDTVARHLENIAPLCNSIIEEATKSKVKEI